MIEIDRYCPEDRPGLGALYRRVLGDERADALLRRWEWQYERNPNLPDGTPLIWLARENGAVVGQYATMPVRLWVSGTEIDAAWGTDVMVAPEGQRKGLGNRLFETWDRAVGASIGLGLTDASAALFRKLQWPDLGRVPRFVKQLATGPWPRARVALAGAARSLLAARRRSAGEMTRVARFDDGVTRLWERVAPRFDFAVRRDAPYLNWKHADAPHVAYSLAVLRRGDDLLGYVVYRHVDEGDKRVTILVDFLADPEDAHTLPTMLRWLEGEAYAAHVKVIRAFSTFTGFHDAFHDAGFAPGPPALRFVAKINAVRLPPEFYSSERWHVTVGDSDADR
jgi:GNAT superfamily N-acetyltransferase